MVLWKDEAFLKWMRWFCHPSAMGLRSETPGEPIWMAYVKKDSK